MLRNMEQAKIKVLGIDASLRSTGLGIVESSGAAGMAAMDYGLVVNRRTLAHSGCLGRLHEGVSQFIEKYKPAAAALEGVFFCRNARTALALGEARGAVMAAASAAGLPVYEYSPRRVKSAVVGFGGAGKEQVRLMVMSLLKLTQPPPEDASDALAIAICHINASRHGFETSRHAI